MNYLVIYSTFVKFNIIARDILYDLRRCEGGLSFPFWEEGVEGLGCWKSAQSEIVISDHHKLKVLRFTIISYYLQNQAVS